MAFSQLVYISAATMPFSEDELQDLLAIARTNNAKLDVSGMLIYHEGAFIQVLEGQEHVVERLFHKIEKDERHANTSILLRTSAEERTFENWSMGYLPTKTAADLPEGFHAFLKTGFKDAFDSEDAVRKALLAFKDGRWRAHL